MAANDQLEALSDILTKLSDNPYDISLHAQHLQVVSSMGKEEQANAQHMFVAFWPATDDIWLPIIDARIEKGAETVEDIAEIMKLFERAESDYLSIPILKRHADFLIERHGVVESSEKMSQDLVELLSTETTRALLQGVARTASSQHMTEGHIVWDVYYQWELEQIERASEAQRPFLITDLEDTLLEHLKEPHSTHDQTFQYYSSFTTTFKPQEIYEKLLVNASKLKAAAVHEYEQRDMNESYLAQAHFSPEAWNQYISHEIQQERFKEKQQKQQKGKRRNQAVASDPSILKGLYERAIADTAKRRLADPALAEMGLRSFWSGYCDHLRRARPSFSDEIEQQVCRRAVRNVPGCGAVWDRLFRCMESSEKDQETLLTSMLEAYEKALSSGLIQKELESLVTIVLSRASLLRRAVVSGIESENAVEFLFEGLQTGINLLYEAFALGDPRYRLEKFLAKTYLDLADSPEQATTVWKTAADHVKSSYLAWINYTDALIREEKIDDARSTFQNIAGRKLDWPEMVFDAWSSFERLHGSLDQIQACLDRIEREQANVDSRRAREAERASQGAYQTSQQMSDASNLISQAVAEVSEPQDEEVPMEVEQQANETTKKRKLEGEDTDTTAKKAKPDSAAPLKRDRENSTVFVSDLPLTVTEDKLKQLFKDCGPIREVKVTEMPNSHVATVEFQNREDVPTGLTKDKKRIDGQEISVSLAWQSTLYVTNFADSVDDAWVRQLFSQFGVIFDVRWPSKKFKATRRFCYVQMTSPDAAQAALSLHRKELSEGLPLTVYISNPERKKERTDAGTSDREICVRGLSKFVTEADLSKLFAQYGAIKDVRVIKDDKDQCKGLAFVEFEEELSARHSLSANNHDLKNRRISVTMSDPRVRAKHRNEPTESGFSHAREARNRSVRISGLPSGTQEGLLQQVLEKTVPVKRLEIFQDLGEATVELESAADAGKLLLQSNALEFNGNKLRVREEGPAAPTKKAGKAEVPSNTMFVPRGARPRAGIGKTKMSTGEVSTSVKPGTGPGAGKSQDDFRKLL